MIKINPPYIHKPSVFKEDVDCIIDSGQFVDGPYTFACENQIKQMVGASDVTIVNNGTGGLELALMNYSIGPGDVVATTPFTYKSTYQAIKRVGATPLFIDINNDLTMNYGQLMALTHHDVQAIIPVDIFGIPNQIDNLRELVGIWPPYIIHDAAQAFGAEINGDRVGNQADATVFSFYPTKICGVGNVGAVATQTGLGDDAILRSLAHCGTERDVVGGNYRASEWDAAALSVNLMDLKPKIKRRREIAEMYKDGLDRSYTKIVDAIPYNANPSWHHFPIWHEGGLPLDLSFETRQYYRDNFKLDDPQVNHCYNFARLVHNIHVIPVHENLTDNEVEYIISELNEAL